MPEKETGYWLRKNGLKSEHLKIWEKEILKMTTSTQYKNEIKNLKKQNFELEKELKTKDKALAEVTALLVLKKKANALFLGEEEN